MRRCSAPSASRIDRGPATGRKGPGLSPRCMTSGGAANTSATACGDQTQTSGASSKLRRSVKASPWRAAQRRSSAVGRSAHSSVCSAAGSPGPTGSTRTSVLAPAARHPLGSAHMSANLAENLTATAERCGERIAQKRDDVELSYALLNEGAARVAGLLGAKGVGPGDRVGVMLPNVPYFAVVYYGILRAGAVVVPMNVLLKGREVAFYLSDPEAKVLFAWHDFAEAAEKGADDAGAECILVEPGEFEKLLAEVEPATEVAERADDDTAVILYTSGTTGTPKGAELTHSNLTRNVEVATGLFEYDSDDVILGALPLFHSFGQTCSLNCAIKTGATLTLLPRFD